MALPLAYPVLIFYYIGHGPKWKCNPNNLNITSCNTTASRDPDDLTRCHMNRTYWVYEDFGKSTTVTEFDLVCNRAWLDALSGSAVFIGWGAGIIIMGYLSDQYGRKRVMYPCLVMSLVCLLMHAFVSNIGLLISLRILMGLFYSAPALNNFIMVMELVGSKYRVIATTMTNLAWPIGALLLTMKAYYIDSWRTLCILCSAPYFFGVLTAACVPESVRWLNMKGRKNEAEEILKRAARMNKKQLPPLLSLKPFEAKDTKKCSYNDLLRRCSIVRLMLLQGFIWFHTGMTYYAINWEFADIGGDMYINCILSFLIELPGMFIGMFLLQKFGRKKTTVAFLAGTALACIGVICTPKTDSMKMWRVSFGLIGKCTISCVFNGIYIWSAEIYSTIARTQGMAINIVTSRAGAACSPFINILRQLHPAGPFISMTITSLIATILALMLPETLNQPTRETLDDMIAMQHHIEMPTVFNFNADAMHVNSDLGDQPYTNLVNDDSDDGDASVNTIQPSLFITD